MNFFKLKSKVLNKLKADLEKHYYIKTDQITVTEFGKEGEVTYYASFRFPNGTEIRFRAIFVNSRGDILQAVGPEFD